MTCCDCNVELRKEDQFPKEEKWGHDQKVWCEKCFKLSQMEMVREEIEDPDERAKTLRDLANRDQIEQPAAKRQRSSRVSCKWCGAATHKTKRSKKCPFYGKTTPVTGPPAAPQTAPPASQVIPAPPSSPPAPVSPAPILLCLLRSLRHLRHRQIGTFLTSTKMFWSQSIIKRTSAGRWLTCLVKICTTSTSQTMGK